MPQTLIPGLDALADWRTALKLDLSLLIKYLEQSDLLPPQARQAADHLTQRLASDKLVMAFVAEFSRGKSELINAIFFSDAGRRILPATPGRTTMCPVELMWDANEPPTLDLLPIDTRRDSRPMADWRERRPSWVRIPLQTDNTVGLARAMSEVTMTREVSIEEARQFGLWSDAPDAENPPLSENNRVEVPAWRHAIINFPHPLLQSGLVVIDTPGLNAIGTEPELTLGLLPGAHAALFVLGADTGVTRSDLDIWTQHLGGHGLSSFVVLNKVDMLADPLASEAEREAAIQRQCAETAHTLQIDRSRVFPVSARLALMARMEGDEEMLRASRLPALEAALNADLLPERQRLLTNAVVNGVQTTLEHATRSLRDQRRQNAEQILELRGLRGKSSSRVAQTLARVETDRQEFERCNVRISALRSVQSRMLRAALAALDTERIREGVTEVQETLKTGWFHLRAKATFAKLCEQLRAQVDRAEHECEEIAHMLKGTFAQLNAEYGFSLTLVPRPDLSEIRQDVITIEEGYGRYFGVTQSIRMNSPEFGERFKRMLTSKLRAVFEDAREQINAWSRAATAQMDDQYHERWQSLRRRAEALQRIVKASDELEQRLAEVETQDARLLEQIEAAQNLANVVRERAERGPWPASGSQFGELADTPARRNVA